jgi:L-ascorbate metabolism protein UlaG (beta-lactamase superfamily)
MAGSSATFTWYGHSCIELHTPGGRTVIFDPWFGNPTSPKSADQVAQCDVMLVTHGHFDHIGSAPRDVANADALSIARRTRPAWPCIHELSLWLETQLGGDSGVEIIGMNKGGTVETRGLKVVMVHADHSAGDWLPPGEPMTGWRRESAGPMYLGEPVGFVVELEDGRRLYFAGDTALFRDMEFIGQLHTPDVAFLPIGGHFTMDPEAAAIATRLLGVEAVIPIHYGTFPILAGTPEQLRRELTRAGIGTVQVISPERGVPTPLP